MSDTPPESMPASEPSGVTPTQSASVLPRTKRVGVASLVVGILAILGAAIPLVNLISGILAIAGLILGIISLTRAGARTGPAIAGTVVSSVALVLSIITTIILLNYQCCQIQ
ncbi:MAG: hypothetical protein LH616_12995 [Ilumatobacteraceae bacterium]|nr:hypothetical protein [Ilumatobacteraceae bacterium]